MSPSGPRGLRLAAIAASVASIVGPFSNGATPDKPIPFPLKLERLDGHEIEVAPGAPVLHLVFFATWCPPCTDELRALADLESRWAGRGYRLVLVAVRTRQTRERLTTFVREASPPGALLFDGSGGAAEACGADRLPLHLVFDAVGNVVVRSDRLAGPAEAAVEHLLTGPHKGGGR